jgi:hypothetical protein
MCRSDPQAGSALADIVTRAESLDDGNYRLFGSKLCLSAGVQALTEDIVTVKKWNVLDHELLIESDELTPSLKLKRCVVFKWNKQILDAFYPRPVSSPRRAPGRCGGGRPKPPVAVARMADGDRVCGGPAVRRPHRPVAPRRRAPGRGDPRFPSWTGLHSCPAPHTAPAWDTSSTTGALASTSATGHKSKITLPSLFVDCIWRATGGSASSVGAPAAFTPVKQRGRFPITSAW